MFGGLCFAGKPRDFLFFGESFVCRMENEKSSSLDFIFLWRNAKHFELSVDSCLRLGRLGSSVHLFAIILIWELIRFFIWQTNSF